jgi:hypothetical protein
VRIALDNARLRGTLTQAAALLENANPDAQMFGTGAVIPSQH